MTDLSLSLDGNGGAIGVDHISSDDVCGKGGRMAFCFLAASNCNHFFSFLSLRILCLISSISAKEATSHRVTWDDAKVNSISVGSS